MYGLAPVRYTLQLDKEAYSWIGGVCMHIVLTVSEFHPVQCTLKSIGYACGSELHSEVPALHPPATVDEVCGTEWVIGIITVHPQPVTDHLPVSHDWVSGYHSQSVVSWRNASATVCAIGACREWECIILAYLLLLSQ